MKFSSEKNTLSIFYKLSVSVGVCVRGFFKLSVKLWVWVYEKENDELGYARAHMWVCACERKKSARFPLLAEHVRPVRKWTHLPSSCHRLLLLSPLLTPPSHVFTLPPKLLYIHQTESRRNSQTLAYKLDCPHTSTHHMIPLHLRLTTLTILFISQIKHGNAENQCGFVWLR